MPRILNVVRDFEPYPIKPYNIDSEVKFTNTFGSDDKDIIARWLVKLAQTNGGWKPFTQGQATQFYNRKGGQGACPVNKLTEWLVKENGEYLYTHQFISRCFASSPKLSE